MDIRGLDFIVDFREPCGDSLWNELHRAGIVCVPYHETKLEPRFIGLKTGNSLTLFESKEQANFECPSRALNVDPRVIIDLIEGILILNPDGSISVNYGHKEQPVENNQTIQQKLKPFDFRTIVFDNSDTSKEAKEAFENLMKSFENSVKIDNLKCENFIYGKPYLGTTEFINEGNGLLSQIEPATAKFDEDRNVIFKILLEHPLEMQNNLLAEVKKMVVNHREKLAIEHRDQMKAIEQSLIDLYNELKK